MKWFDQWFFKKCRDAWSDAHQPVERYSNTIGTAKVRESDSVQSDPQLNFKVYSAVGGKIVEFTRYDRIRDRAEHQTYIITSDQDFGERIAKIATLENLKA